MRKTYDLFGCVQVNIPASQCNYYHDFVKLEIQAFLQTHDYVQFNAITNTNLYIFVRPTTHLTENSTNYFKTFLYNGQISLFVTMRQWLNLASYENFKD